MIALVVAIAGCGNAAIPPPRFRVAEEAYAVSPDLPERILELRHRVVSERERTRSLTDPSTVFCLLETDRHLVAVDAIAGSADPRELATVPLALATLADEITDCRGPLRTVFEQAPVLGSDLWIARAFERKSALGGLVTRWLDGREHMPPVARARVTLEAAWGVLAMEDSQRAVELFREAAAAFESLEVHYGEFRALVGLAAALGQMRDHAAALDAAERALALTRGHRDDPSWRIATAGALRAVIASLVARDDPERALELATEARDLDSASRGEDHATVALDLEWRAVALRRLERVEEAAVDLARAIELRAALAGLDHPSLYTSRIELAHLDLGRGNTRDAERGFAWARDASRTRGDPVLEGWAEVALAQLYGLDRPFPNAIAFDPSAALAALDRADRLFEGDGSRARRGSSAALVARGSILSRLGRTEDALAAIERALAIESEPGLLVTRAELLHELARPDAVASFEAAVAAVEADPRSTPLEKARAHWLFANALRAAGDLARTRGELAAASRALSESRARDAELAARIDAFATAYAE